MPLSLTATREIDWTEDSVPPEITPGKVYFGPDPHGIGGFQVATATSKTTPSRQLLRALFTARKGKTQIQLVVAVEHGASTTILGPDPQSLPVELATDQAERQLQSVLTEPDQIAAGERLTSLRKANESSGAAGFANNGLFASHHIKHNVPKRADWKGLADQAKPLLNRRAIDLIKGLGFEPRPGPNSSILLTANTEPPRVVAVLLEDAEQFDTAQPKFGNTSAVSLGLAVAHEQSLPWLIVLRKDQIRLYPGKDGVGVGSKGQAETYFEIDLANIDADYVGLLPLVFSAAALADAGFTDELLRDSGRYATELGVRLRERVYDEIVPPMAVEVANALNRSTDLELDQAGLATAYRVTLRILFRLLFQAYAEDRRLLPADRNEYYAANSIKENGRRLLAADAPTFGESSSLWNDLVQVWNVIDKGNEQWQVPAYNGGLFIKDAERSPEGALIAEIELPDSVLGPALRSLLIDYNEDGAEGLVDFSSLSVREFGTIYEGLLESSLSIAGRDLTVDTAGAWVPAGEDDEVLAPEGAVYFHTASGERKATGSYFTPKVIVDHLVEHSIVPALSSHLDGIARHLEAGDGSAAARDFFDFRVADLAMGSGHFLVAAVDKIEALMRTFLTKHSVPGVTDELLRLASSARDALGDDDVAKSEVDEVGLLRRQIARRCIYGLDINPMAVELARLALWIHTFVPGLPMSNLDHGLVNASSLTGIGTTADALDALQPGRRPGQIGLFDEILEEQLASSKALLEDLANASEANKSEVDEGARLLAEAREAAVTSRRIFDAAVAVRMDAFVPEEIVDTESLSRVLGLPVVAETASELLPAHMPFLFPEVFTRDDPGFDVLIGNPPWEKVRHEPQQFWVVRDPGLNSRPASERVRRIEELRAADRTSRDEELKAIAVSERLTRYFGRAYRMQASQHYDFAKLFAERNLALARHSGTVGLVLPQALLVLGGWRPIREAMVANRHLVVAPIRNSGGWAFENVHAQTTMCVLTVGPGEGVSVWPAAADELAFASLDATARLDLSLEDLRDLSEELNVPWFESANDPVVFSTMSAYPRLGSGDGWIVGHADSTRWDFSSSGRNANHVEVGPASESDWRVTMTRHVSPFLMSPTAEGKWIANPRQLVSPQSGLIESGGRVVLGLNHPPLAYRFPTNNDNSRTLIAAAMPAKGWLFSKGYAHGISVPEEATKTDILALLGYLNSIPADWWARRFVDRHLGKRVIEGLPLPHWDVSTREKVAKLVEGILVGAGMTEIAGPRALDLSSPAAPLEEVMTELDAMAFLGLGIEPDEAESVFADFAETQAALPAERRTAIVESMFRLAKQ